LAKHRRRRENRKKSDSEVLNKGKVKPLGRREKGKNKEYLAEGK